jgi:hypothetical protein
MLSPLASRKTTPISSVDRNRTTMDKKSQNSDPPATWWSKSTSISERPYSTRSIVPVIEAGSRTIGSLGES